MAGATVVTGAPRLDLGCGTRDQQADRSIRIIGFHPSPATIDGWRAAFPDGLCIQGDFGALPFAPGTFGGAWSSVAHLQVPQDRLPMALWDLQRVLKVGAPLELLAPLVLRHPEGGDDGGTIVGDPATGHSVDRWTRRHLIDVVTGAGFEVDERSVPVSGDGVWLSAVRSRTLADTVGPGMRLLVCGSNPSLHSADAGVGYFRAGNRFWKAALAGGIVSRDRDPHHALDAHGIGMTDQVKRPSRAADEVSPEEYRRGLERVQRLVRWLRPDAVCMVGLGGWRAVAGARAHAGPQDATLGGRPLYVMPSTSGLNARTSVVELSAHLRAALALGDGAQAEHKVAGRPTMPRR